MRTIGQKLPIDCETESWRPPLLPLNFPRQFEWAPGVAQIMPAGHT